MVRLFTSGWNGHWSISPEKSETEWSCVNVAGYKIIIVYKPPHSWLIPTAVPTFPHPILYAGDFHCQPCQLGLQHNTSRGESLDSWAAANNLALLHNSKGVASFFSHKWNVGTIPDLACMSAGQDNRLPERRVLGKCPRSRHRPYLIIPPRLKVHTYSDSVKG